MASNETFPKPPSESWRAIDFLLQGESVKFNPYLKRFASSSYLSTLLNDPSLDSMWRRKSKELRKELIEAYVLIDRLVQIRDAHAHGDPTVRGGEGSPTPAPQNKPTTVSGPTPNGCGGPCFAPPCPAPTPAPRSICSPRGAFTDPHAFRWSSIYVLERGLGQSSWLTSFQRLVLS